MSSFDIECLVFSVWCLMVSGWSSVFSDFFQCSVFGVVLWLAFGGSCATGNVARA